MTREEEEMEEEERRREEEHALSSLNGTVPEGIARGRGRARVPEEVPE